MKIMIANWNNVLTDVIKELRRQKEEGIDDIKDADVIVVWNEAKLPKGGGGRKDVKEAKALGVRTVLVQHGRTCWYRVEPPFNEEILSDKVCVWGEGDKKRLLQAGTPPEKIVVTGTTIFGHLKKREPHKGKIVVFDAEHWKDSEIDENLCIAGTLRRMGNVKIVTKILEGEHNPDWYDNPVVSNRDALGHLEICADVLKTADVVVGISESTFELMAQVLDIPVVIADIWIPRPKGSDKGPMVYSNACKRTKDIFQLNKLIKQQLEHPEELREERKQIAIDDGGINIKNPLERLIKVIKNE